ncbi:hypothetical protein CEP52_005963 [Fusarium oligoseptatum]|uniref:Uncharacterized protein n=1 Tax=Fusarium oligoseptatum TaxID=2604345 RepID=A0A428TV53_9HYPO|nr:hypothetical protein CEP52_005963 [Fusarium oligoseptatum]
MLSLLALQALDAEIAKSEDLKADAPLKLVSSGGFVAVDMLGTREMTTEIDYILNPDSIDRGKLRRELYKAIVHVGRSHNISRSWMRNVESFVQGDDNEKQRLVRDSISQDIALWRGANLTVYAVEWHWALAQKLKMMEDGREADTRDGVAILSELYMVCNGPIPRNIIQSWDNLVSTPIQDSTIDVLAAAFLARYGYVGVDKA